MEVYIENELMNGYQINECIECMIYEYEQMIN